jgi:energy-converting hydrogenase Eha subunit C
MTAYFLGGATGSGLSALVYATHGWLGVAVVGAAFPALATLLLLVDTALRRRARRAVSATSPATGS